MQVGPVPANHVAAPQALQRLVGVHEGHSQRVGDVLLSEGKIQRVAVGKAKMLRARKQMKQQISDAFDCTAAA